jgi:hypothetical protein
MNDNSPSSKESSLPNPNPDPPQAEKQAGYSKMMEYLTSIFM